MSAITEFLGKPVSYWMAVQALIEAKGIDGYIERLAQLEAKLEAMQCGECEKSMLDCECDE